MTQEGATNGESTRGHDDFAAEWRRFHPLDHLVELRAPDEDSVVDILADHIADLARNDDVLVIIPDTASDARARLLSRDAPTTSSAP